MKTTIFSIIINAPLLAIGLGIEARKQWEAHNMSRRSLNAAIALMVGIFDLAYDAYESGEIVRGWYETARNYWNTIGKATVVSELAPCVEAAKTAKSWVLDADRCWSAQNLPATIAEVRGHCKAAGDRAVNFVDTYLMGA